MRNTSIIGIKEASLSAEASAENSLSYEKKKEEVVISREFKLDRSRQRDS